MKFWLSNVDFSGLNLDRLSSRRSAHASVKEGYPSKKWLFLPILARLAWKQLQIGISMLLIITSANNELFWGIYLDDLERPWTPKIRGFTEFFATTHILKVNCAERLELDQNNLHRNFSALNVDFSSLSPDPLSSRRPAHEHQKCTSSNNWLFCRYWLTWKKLQIGIAMLFIITNTGDELFSRINIDEHE